MYQRIYIYVIGDLIIEAEKLDLPRGVVAPHIPVGSEKQVYVRMGVYVLLVVP